MPKYSLEEILFSLFEEVGEDPNREALSQTPDRLLRMYRSFLKGYRENVTAILGSPIPIEANDKSDVITLCHIPFISLCEHHLLPFHGKIHIAYVPHQTLIGFGHIPALIDHFAKRLQLQERLSSQIADTLQEFLNPHGVMVLINAFQTCSLLAKQDNKQTMQTTTTALRGSFINDLSLQNHLYQQMTIDPLCSFKIKSS